MRTREVIEQLLRKFKVTACLQKPVQLRSGIGNSISVPPVLCEKQEITGIIMNEIEHKKEKKKKQQVSHRWSVTFILQMLND